MRLLHMADAHFGKRFSSSRFGAESALKRRKTLEEALRLTVRYANENEADAILCAGDLIESGEIRPSDLKTLARISWSSCRIPANGIFPPRCLRI